MITAGANPDFDAIVVGGGAIGLAMASLLVRRGCAERGRVAVIGERFSSASVAPGAGSPADWDLRVFALSRASQRVLEACGAWQALPESKRSGFERMCVWDALGEARAAGSLTFDCANVGEANLGYIVEGRALLAACISAAADAGVVLLEALVHGASATRDEVRVQCNDGREVRGRLLIAADGVESTTRELLGIDTAGHAYHQDALVAHVATSLAHGRTAWQRFLTTGPLAFLPLPDGRSSIVWSTDRDEAARLRALDRDAFGAALTIASGAVLGSCELTTAVASFPLKLQYALDYVRPRCVLLGDAAHAVHPLAGQGLNLGLLDCAVLAEVLAEGRGADALGDMRLLRRYERRRRGDNLVTATALDGLQRLFAQPGALPSRLRLAGLALVDGAPFLKRRLVARAMGLAGDLPAFLVKADRLSPRR